MPLPPHKNVTGLDFQALENQIAGLNLVRAQVEKYTDIPASERHAAFLAGAVAALSWVAGGVTGTELYTAQLDGEELLRQKLKAELGA